MNTDTNTYRVSGENFKSQLCAAIKKSKNKTGQRQALTRFIFRANGVSFSKSNQPEQTEKAQ